MKIAVVLFNLGGPDTPEAVEPFLENLFSDPAVIPLPKLLRLPLARAVAKQRAPTAIDIYSKIGGHSPILEQTEAQARALESKLCSRGIEAKVFVVMRAWKPRATEAAQAIRSFKPDRIILLPLYPQFSTTTTGSSVDDWRAACRAAGLDYPESRICCYPSLGGFVSAEADLISTTLKQRRRGVDYRLLLSAHGLPKRTVSKGDPYQWQMKKSAKAIVERLGISNLDWKLCYQSRIGPLEWLGPTTGNEIRRAGQEDKGVVIAPIAFVSEHSETLVELDIEYARLATQAGAPDFLRVPAVGVHPLFIGGLTEPVLRAIGGESVVTCGAGRICPREFRRCGFERVYG